MNDAPTVGPRGCPRHKTSRYGEIHVCQRKEHHLGLHRDPDGFLWADEAVAVGRHIAVDHVQYYGTNTADVEAFLGAETRPHETEAPDFYPVVIPLGPHGTILFPSDHLLRLEDGTVLKLSDRDYTATWRTNG